MASIRVHAAAYEFVRSALKACPPAGKVVLEIGSRDINGSVRPLFAGCGVYTAIDFTPGPGVDFCSHAAQLPPDWDLYFDIVVSTEALEHDPSPELTVRAAFRLLTPGGRLILTCASGLRPPHSGVAESTILQPGEHYAGISPADLTSWLLAAGFTEVKVAAARGGMDVCCIATKPGDGFDSR